jgi:hypothetical protein
MRAAMFSAWRGALTLMTLVACGSAACDRTPEPKNDASRQMPAPAGAPAPAPAVEQAEAPKLPAAPAGNRATSAEPFRFPGSSRLVAVGDLHGDVRALRAALVLAGAIDAEARFIGKDLTVVQTGDQIDRGDADREVLDLLEKLEPEAKAAGCSLHVLNGNHELMNAQLDFRYVSERGFTSFAELAASAPASAARLPAEQRGRAAAFAPGGSYAQKLARHPTVAMVGDTLFAHGGVLPAHVDYGLSRINAEVSDFLAGKRSGLPPIMLAEDAPTWVRLYGAPEVDAEACQVLGRVLQQLGAKRLVVGHTIQKQGISSACQDRLFRIDVGLSAYYGDRPPEVLEITAAGAKVLKGGDAPAAAANAAKRKGAPRDSALHSPP